MYTEIFKEILLVTHHDYAGYKDKEGWDRPEYYLNEIEQLENKHELTDELFSQLVNEYLLDFNDKHMYFTVDGKYTFAKQTCGFNVKWYYDALYIVSLNQEKSLSIGDKIISIDHIPIKEISTIEQKRLRESIPGRQRWYTILNSANSIQYVNQHNEIIDFTLDKYDIENSEEVFEHKLLNEHTYYIKLPNLIERDKIMDYVNEAIEQFKELPNLIIDLRDNGGGDATTIAALEPFMFATDEKPNNAISVRLFNCTERNVNLFIQLCDTYRDVELDSNTRNMLSFAETTFKNNRGKGFVEVDFAQILEAMQKEFEGTDKPENVIILMDENTASAAESFIEGSLESSKVMTLGRATMGINDYSDLVIQNWGGKYELYYPMSKLESLTTHHPVFGTGIHPNVHVPWSPEFLIKDKDLEKALEILNEKAVLNN